MHVRFGQFCLMSGLLALLMTACQTQQPTPDTDVPPGTGGVVVPGTPVTENKPQTAGPQAPAKEEGRKKYEPVQVGPYVPKVPGRRVARVSVPGPYVALTFDDGPSAANTPRILDILKAHGARATFFVQGKMAVGNKGILARAAAEGHELGAHTYSHINLLKSSDEKISSEMSRTISLITDATGRTPRVMRPPYGAINSRLVDKMYNDYGMPSILWDVDTNDWRHPGVSVVINRAVTNARPGSIILVHDIHASTADAVEGIVTGLQERGFKLVTVSELLAMAGKGAAPAPESKPEAPKEEAPAAETPAEAPADAPVENTEGSASISGSANIEG